MKNILTLTVAILMVIFSSCCASKQARMEKKEIKNFISLVENNKLSPSDSVMTIFDSVKKDLIIDIKKYKLDSIKEKTIIDSINNVRVIELGKNYIPNGYRAFFMNFNKLKDKKSDKLVPLVILSDKLIQDNHIREVIRHELYHYIDYLLGKNDYNSKSLGIINYLVYEEFNYYRRISVLLYKEVKDIYSYEEVIAINYVADMYLSNASYYCLPEELFVRYHSMKKRMVELNIIKDINYPISINDVMNLIEKDEILMKVALKDTPEYMPILLFLDMDRIGSFDKKMSLSFVE